VKVVEEEPHTDDRANRAGGAHRSDARRASAPDVHAPVLVEPVIDAFTRALGPKPEGFYVDGTIGAGGHAARLLEHFPKLTVVGCDWDPDSLLEAERTLAPFAGRFELVRARLSELAETCAERGAPLAVLADLGVCSLHLDRAERGFSFMSDGPLDMRMDPSAELTAADVVNRTSENDLADLLFHEGGERKSRRVAAAIVAARQRLPFKRTAALAGVISEALGGQRGKTHPATRSFQALRRAVNGEGRELDALLDDAHALLAPGGGALVVITFHSGEDGVVKRAFGRGRRAERWELLTDGAVEPSRYEVRTNPRARSARLRAARALTVEVSE
jgi:16S rRNA (cytosine1402-N4)-methyltransferase